jgi:ppGpp synthetase/RelA/SpoT-type nucleotidyltranferase
MIIPKDIAQKYNFLIPYFEKVKEIIDQTLINFSSIHHFAYSSRIKELDSLAEKIESGRYKDWNSIDDFIGAVIIIPNINYEPDILKFLDTSFVKVDLKKRGSTWKSPDVFRFDATRFIGKIAQVDSLEIVNTINFEIQIRSAFEHAWSVTTHDLAYKSTSIDWKVLRLAAQLKSSVEQLDMITLGAYEIKTHIQEHKWPETEIKIRICNFIEKMFTAKIIPDELKPKDMSRFSENIFLIIKNSISINLPKKWKTELSDIFKLLENNFNQFSQGTFPMSLSLYQLCFGILLKENILSEKINNEHPFHKSELFYTIFPECKDKRIKEFII